MTADDRDLAKLTPKARRELLDVGRTFVTALLEQAILVGEIDPAGKSAAELDAEFKAFLRRIVDAGPDAVVLKVAIDHRSTLLKEARRFKDIGGDEIACILYATWLEHWINHAVTIGCARRGRSQDEAVLIIREASFKGKFTWLLPLLGLRRVHAPHEAAVLRLAELRNGFVHYKWRGHEIDEWKPLDIGAALTEIERTITYLKQYERKYLLAGGGTAIRQFVSRRRADPSEA